MLSRVVGLMATQHGLITRRQAMEAGLTNRELDRHVRSGRWVLVRRGVYAEAGTVAALVSLGDKQRLVDRAACLRITVPFVRSHETAALELGMGVLLPARRMTHVTRPCVGTHNKHGIKHHLAPYRHGDVTSAHGFQLLSAPRTAIDIAREHGSPYGEVAIDRVRWSGVSVEELEAVLATMAFWPDYRRATSCLMQSDGGAESVGETLLRLLLEEAGIIDLETQFGMRDHRREAWADIRAGRQLFEFDGELKYDSAGAVFEEKKREDWFRGFRLGMTRLTWSDVWGPGRVAAKARAARDYAATTRAWGTSIDDLAPYVIRGHRRAA